MGGISLEVLNPCMLLLSERLPEGVAERLLDALPWSAAILNRDFQIIALNQAWVAYGQANGARDPASFLGADYLAICRLARGRGSMSAQRAGDGLRDVASGRVEHFVLDYDCSTPDEERWSTMQASAVGDHILVTHRATSLDAVLARNADHVPAELLALVTHDMEPALDSMNLAPLIQEVLEEYGRHARMPETMIYDNLWILGDEALLGDTLRGLLSHGGPVRHVAADSTKEQVVVTIRSDRDPGPWDGFGIEPFDWRKWDGEFGLPLARAVMEAHAGQMFVWSHHGTVINLVFPRMPGAPAPKWHMPRSEFLMP